MAREVSEEQELEVRILGELTSRIPELIKADQRIGEGWKRQIKESCKVYSTITAGNRMAGSRWYKSPKMVFLRRKNVK